MQEIDRHNRIGHSYFGIIEHLYFGKNRTFLLWLDTPHSYSCDLLRSGIYSSGIL